MEPMVYFVDVTWTFEGRRYTTNYFVNMDREEVQRVRGFLGEAEKAGRVASFDMTPVGELVYEFREFLDEVRENHPEEFRMFRKRWF